MTARGGYYDMRERCSTEVREKGPQALLHLEDQYSEQLIKFKQPFVDINRHKSGRGAMTSEQPRGYEEFEELMSSQSC